MTNAERKEFGSRIKQVRKALRIDRYELARLTKTSYPCIANIENGNNSPSMSKYLELCRALKVEAGALFADC